MKLEPEIIRYFTKNHIVLVSTIDAENNIYSSVKGIVDINESGKVYLVDLYKNNTYKNIKRDNRISIAAVNVKMFNGYVLQGKAFFLNKEQVGEDSLMLWEQRLVSRISERIIRNLQEGTSEKHHEAELPKVKYFIEINVENVIDLTPPKKRKEKK